MISTIVLEPDGFPRGEDGRARMVRSLGWLIGAAVAGVVGEVVIAASPGLSLAGIADAVGARLVEGDGEGSRLRAAAAIVRSDRALLMVAGYAPDAGAVDEIARLAGPAARLLAEPLTLVQWVLPARSPTVGLLLPAASLRAARDLPALRRAAAGAPVLTARARRLG